MRKFISFLFLLLALIVSSSDLMAQNKRRPPLPDWVLEKPQRSNTTFYYHVEKGTGETETEARNAAYTQAFMQVALKLGIPLNTEDISEAVANGTNVKLLSQRFTIPMNVVCYCSRKDEAMGGWNYWILCQVPEIGHADNVRFDDFNDCYKHDKYIEFQERKEAEAEKRRQDSLQIVKSNNARAIAASSFIPGMGQMLKGQYGAGAGFLIGELALFGSGTACYFLADKQNNLMAQRGISYDEYNNAKNLKKTYNIAMYCCFGAGAALHIVNMCHAYMCFDKKLAKRLSAFEPAIIPTNEYSNTNFAVGVKWHHEF